MRGGTPKFAYCVTWSIPTTSIFLNYAAIANNYFSLLFPSYVDVPTAARCFVIVAPPMI